MLQAPCLDLHPRIERILTLVIPASTILLAIFSDIIVSLSAKTSPVAGLIVGSAVGFASQSETVQKVLFGEKDEQGERTGGIINKEVRDRIKKAIPNMSAGAIAGLLVGPFGVVENIMIGSAIGFLTSSDKFHKYIFGDGGEDKGLAGIIHDKIIKNLDDLFHNTANALKGWLVKTGTKVTS